MGEAWNAGDMAALREVYDPDVIVRVPDGWPEPGPFVGREAVMRQWERNRESWDADTFEAVGDLIDAGDRVVVRLVWRGVGRGPRTQLEFTAVYTVRKGKVSYQESFWNHAEALEAVGLPEQPIAPATHDDALRESIEGINSKDPAAIEAACDPDLELTSSFSAVEGKTYRGYAGARDYLLVVLRVRGMGRGSGVPFDQRTYGVYEFRRGKVWRARFSPSRDEALDGVGRSDQDAHADS
jgi:ketosteroid isomerase-like protein